MSQDKAFSQEEVLKHLKDFESMAIRVKNGKLELLDQRVLPHKETWLPCNTPQEMWDHIETLAVRGAPMIGCAAALYLAVHAVYAYPNDAKIVETAEYLKTSRPTAVNLMYACDRVTQKGSESPDHSYQNICKLAYEVVNNEMEMNERMATYGASLIQDGDNILTHCNTGSLATPGLGTALGVIRKAHQQNKKIHVYVDETRPLLQGGRLTAYELQKEGIPYTLICDNMAATLMRQGKVQRVFVGADRIATNGDFANKIGTYSLAVIAKHHNVPFHPVAPVSTVDFKCETGHSIPIEQRKGAEVQGALGNIWAPHDSPTFNPAFDVTPIDLTTSLILDTGVYTQRQLLDGILAKKDNLVIQKTQ